jgi:hypothetical protein
MPVRFTKRRRAAKWKPSSKVARLLSAAGVKVRAPRKSPEHDAQVTLFRDHIWPYLVPGAVAFAIPNGGHRAKKVAAEMRDEGLTPGAPDIFAIHAGQTYFLEMKAPRGSLSPEQIDMMARLEAAGAICAVAKGLEAAIRQLETWRLLVSPGQVLAADREMAA